MTITQITAEYSVSGQITAEDVPTIVADGYRALMCNRPDGEAAGQPDFATIARAAEAHGLQTAFVPVISGQIRPEDVVAFREAVDGLPKPVLAYCRSGARCQALWTFAKG